jgi:signal transduction histidine kinase
LSVLLDGAPYKEGVAKDKRLFVQGLALSLALVLLGSVVFPLLTRHRRLEADLRLAREREKRLKERSELGAGLAHETKNPLTLIRGLAQSQMERTGNADTAKPSDAETAQALRRIVDEVDQVVGRINSFLEYARTPSPRPVDMDLSQAVAGTVQLFRDEAAAKRVDLRQSLAPVRAAADPAMLRQVVVNLLANALAACGEGDTIEVGLGNGSVATLSVRDTGEGIAPEDVPRVREPYFSRREGGTGLGLAIVDQIVQAHGWRLDISSRPGEGTLVRILDIAISGRGAPAR